MGSLKILNMGGFVVIPANAGIQNRWENQKL